MRAQLRRMGNSSGVIIPKPVLAPLPDHPRAGWAEAAREIAAAGDDTPVWPEFGNEADAMLEW